MVLPTIIRENKKIAVFGEAGSGKTELSMNLAALIREELAQPIRFLDMDQTKPLLRARDRGDELRAAGITFTVQEEFQDAHIMPYGVNESLADPDLRVILDVGGSYAGALNMGQFADSLQKANALILYSINPYRSFSDTTEHIEQTLRAIEWACHLENMHIVSNPYLGHEMTKEEYWEGHDRLVTLLKPLHKKPELLLAPEGLSLTESEAERAEVPLITIKPYLGRVLNISPA